MELARGNILWSWRGIQFNPLRNWDQLMDLHIFAVKWIVYEVRRISHDQLQYSKIVPVVPYGMYMPSLPISANTAIVNFASNPPFPVTYLCLPGWWRVGWASAINECGRKVHRSGIMYRKSRGLITLSGRRNLRLVTAGGVDVGAHGNLVMVL